MSSSDCIECPRFQLSQCYETLLYAIRVQFVRVLVDLSGKLLTDIVGAGRRVAEFLRKLVTVVLKVLKSRRFRVFLGIVLHGLMWFLSACFMALLFNDISFLLQNDKTSIEQNHNHVMMGTHISRAIYLVLLITLMPYWTWNGWQMADHLPDRTKREWERQVAHLLRKKLQSLIPAQEAFRIEVKTRSDATSMEDLGTGPGASSPIRQDVESGGGTPTPIPSQTSKTFLCILTIEETNKIVSIELLQRFEPDLILKGSKVLYKRFKINPQQPDQLDNYVSQIVASMSLAHDVDEDCFLQLGSSAIFKYTATGPKMWILQEDWTPGIIDVCRQWRLFDYLFGRPAIWIIRGCNLQGATLRVASMDKSEDLKVLVDKHESGVDIIICEEPPILLNLGSTFQGKQSIFAFKIKKMEDGVSLKLRSEAKDVQRAYWTSVVGAFMPGQWITMISVALSLLGQVYCKSRFGRKLLFSKLLSSFGIVVHIYNRCARTYTSAEPTLPTVMPTCEHTLETHQIWTHLWTEIYITVYLVYLFLIIFILSWKLLLPPSAPPPGLKSLVTHSPRPGSTDSPCAVGSPPSVTQPNHHIWELHSPSRIPPMDILFFLGQLWDCNNLFWKTWASTNKEHMIWLKEWLNRRFLVPRILCVSYNFYAAEIVGQPNTLKENLVSSTILKEKCYQLSGTTVPCIQGRVIKNFTDVSEENGLTLSNCS